MPHNTGPLKTCVAKHIHHLVNLLWVSSFSDSFDEFLHDFCVGLLGQFLDWFSLYFSDLGSALLLLLFEKTVLLKVSLLVAMIAWSYVCLSSGLSTVLTVVSLLVAIEAFELVLGSGVEAVCFSYIDIHCIGVVRLRASLIGSTLSH